MKGLALSRAVLPPLPNADPWIAPARAPRSSAAHALSEPPPPLRPPSPYPSRLSVTPDLDALSRRYCEQRQHTRVQYVKFDIF
jgi:hypothetical protein